LVKDTLMFRHWLTLRKFRDDQARDERGRFAFEGNAAGGSFSTIAPGTPEFKAWFAGSKAVDSKGNPLVFFHGTTKEFSTFNPDVHSSAEIVMADARLGAHFTEDPKTASYMTSQEPAWGPATGQDGHGSVVPVYLAIKNPKVIDQYQVHHEHFTSTETDQAAIPADMAQTVFPNNFSLFQRSYENARRWTPEQTRAVWEALKAGRPLTEEMTSSSAHRGSGWIGEGAAGGASTTTGADLNRIDFRSFTRSYSMDPFNKAMPDLVSEYRRTLEAQGYDAVMYENTSPMETRGAQNRRTWIVWHPEQIKSVHNARPTRNPDIMKDA
jgi:hypothetical protein